MDAARNALAFVAMLTIGFGCGGSSDATRLSASEGDQYDERINEINRTWEEFRVAGNACTTADAGPCFEAALESSGFEQAVTDLRATVDQFRANVDAGDCRSSLDSLDAKLGTLLAALASLREDAEAGDAEGIASTAHAVRAAWDAAVDAQEPSSEVCF